MRVLVVDDSVVFRSQIKNAIDGISGIEVIGVAANGKMALQKLQQSSTDLVTLDMEMPEMGGLETIKEIRKAKFPVKIIVFSSHTTRGSEAALDALSAGADDFIAKPTGPGSTIETVGAKIRDELLPKILQFDKTKQNPVTAAQTATSVTSVRPCLPKRDLSVFRPSAILIGSSTGGPPALETVLSQVKPSINIPIFIVQHMPALFTASLATRLQTKTGIPTAEAKPGEVVQLNKIYIAPGNYHLALKKSNSQIECEINQGPQRNSVRPAVDILFESAVEIYGPRAMGFILTGMGEDGLQGCRMIKDKGGGVMIQDKESCVVFGMPGAVFTNGCYDKIGGLVEIGNLIGLGYSSVSRREKKLYKKWGA